MNFDFDSFLYTFHELYIILFEDLDKREKKGYHGAELFLSVCFMRLQMVAHAVGGKHPTLSWHHHNPRDTSKHCSRHLISHFPFTIGKLTTHTGLSKRHCDLPIAYQMIECFGSADSCHHVIAWCLKRWIWLICNLGSKHTKARESDSASDRPDCVVQPHLVRVLWHSLGDYLLDLLYGGHSQQTAGLGVRSRHCIYLVLVNGLIFSSSKLRKLGRVPEYHSSNRVLAGHSWYEALEPLQRKRRVREMPTPMAALLDDSAAVARVHCCCRILLKH